MTPMTRDQLRADIAEVMDAPADSFGAEDNLIDAGLDSMRAMNLAMAWEERGVPLDFADLAEAPTLAGLHALVAERQGAPSA